MAKNNISNANRVSVPNDWVHVVVPGGVIDRIRERLDQDDVPYKYYYGMAVQLGRTPFTIEEAVGELRSYERFCIYDVEASVLASPLSKDEVVRMAREIWGSAEYVEYRTKRLSAMSGGARTEWRPDYCPESDIKEIHRIQQMAIDGEGSGNLLFSSQTCMPVGAGWSFPGRTPCYDYITNNELTREEISALSAYVFNDGDGELPF